MTILQKLNSVTGGNAKTVGEAIADLIGDKVFTVENAEVQGAISQTIFETLEFKDASENRYQIKVSSGSITAVRYYAIDLSGVGENVTVVAKDANDKVLTNGDLVLNGSVVKFTVTYADGYEKDTLTVGGSAYTAGANFTVNAANVAIVATAKAIV